MGPGTEENREQRNGPVQRPLQETLNGAQARVAGAGAQQDRERLLQQQGGDQEGPPQGHVHQKRRAQGMSLQEIPRRPPGKEIRRIRHHAADDQGNRLEESGAAQRQNGGRVRKREWHSGPKTRRSRWSAASLSPRGLRCGWSPPGNARHPRKITARGYSPPQDSHSRRIFAAPG